MALDVRRGLNQDVDICAFEKARARHLFQREKGKQCGDEANTGCRSTWEKVGILVEERISPKESPLCRRIRECSTYEWTEFRVSGCHFHLV
jgi:hypothetical protein